MAFCEVWGEYGSQLPNWSVDPECQKTEISEETSVGIFGGPAVYNIPDRDKCCQIINYCSSRVTWFIEALDSFVNEDWDQLEKDILTYYNAELHESRYLLSNLNKLVKCWRKKGIYNLT